MTLKSLPEAIFGLTMKTIPTRWLVLYFGILPLLLTCLCEPSLSSEVEAPAAETLTIDNETYEIPAPWKGNRLVAPKLTFESFGRIPAKFSKNNSRLYIRAEALPDLVKMLTAAENDGVLIQVESAYRSASYQKKIFRRMLSEGRKFEDIVRYVAPPGYSEHMLGTAVDFSPSNWRFADTDQHRWLLENAHRFGFENTYPEISETNMPWEAWHSLLYYPYSTDLKTWWYRCLIPLTPILKLPRLRVKHFIITIFKKRKYKIFPEL